jgi:hypothetical protein
MLEDEGDEFQLQLKCKSQG